MNDLISRQAAIDAIKEFQHGAAEWRDEQEERSDIWHRADSAIASAIEIGLRVKKLPSAQSEIIRCKDCKHIIEHHYEEEGEQPYIKYTCGNKAGLEKVYQVQEWDFCSRAERREEA